MWDIPYAEQKKVKLKVLSELLHIKSDEIQFHSYAEFGLRQRFDFIIKNNEIGLLNKNKDLIPIKRCLQLNTELQKALSLLHTLPFNIRIGTLRIRNSRFVDKFGLWLDFANTDIKRLLEEKNLLNSLDQHFYIEIGQKKKSFINTSNNEQYKLSEPLPRLWFETYDYKNKKSIGLFSAISSFTQPSAETSKIISDLIINWLQKISAHHIWEFGSGIGQYSIPLLSLGYNLTCFEIDDFAIECLNKSAEHLKEHLQKPPYLEIHKGNFHSKEAFQKIQFKNSPDVILVNPPKSGLKEFTYNLISTNASSIIYISCFPESFKIDIDLLKIHGFETIDIHIVDQFPQTKHFEVIALLQRIHR